MNGRENKLNCYVAAIFSILIACVAAFRPQTFGYDTPLYLEVLDSYWTGGTAFFPDVIFSTYTKFFTSIFPENEINARIYLASISFFQGVLLYNILKNKYIFESMIICVGFGPLIFFDIIRQGTSMLLVGNYLLNSKKYSFLILGLLTHVNSVVVFAENKFILNKKNMLLGLCLFSILAFIAWDEISSRFTYYTNSKDYLPKDGLADLFFLKLSLKNVMAITLFFYAYLIRKFDAVTFISLIFFYLLSIPYPILFRLYFFYFFIVICKSNIDFKNRSLTLFLYNFMLVVVALNFASYTIIKF